MFFFLASYAVFSKLCRFFSKLCRSGTKIASHYSTVGFIHSNIDRSAEHFYSVERIKDKFKLFFTRKSNFEKISQKV